MINRLRRFFITKNNYINAVPVIQQTLFNDLKSPKLNLGQIQLQFNNQKQSINDLSEVEFQVFSQWGDDGIIQYLINKIDIPHKTFIEFGVENYREANTRFLLINNNWTGYVLDGSEENIRYIKNDAVSWACELHAEAAFITVENINRLLNKPGFNPEVGIVSIDIDGNDYWVWKEINSIRPIIVIVEYNSLFGKNKSWTVPYDPGFVRHNKSILYYGASLKAFNTLAIEKGYSFIGCNSKGNNAYFIRNDKLGPLQSKNIEDGFVLAKFREARMGDERLTDRERIESLKNFEIYDLDKGGLLAIDPSEVKY